MSMGLELGLGLEVTPTLSKGVRPLLSLFANGEDGFLFGNFADLTRQFLLSTGSTGNITANDDPVGLALDNHSWGWQTLAQVVAAQPELVTNGGFASGTGWGTDPGWSISGGEAVFIQPGSGNRNVYSTGVSVVAAGKTYAWSYNVKQGTGFRIYLGGVSAQAVASVTTGVHSGVYTAASAGNVLINGVNATNGVVDDILVKLVPGNHALQASTTKRPLWKANSGKPYLAPDGIDDSLPTTYVPDAAGGLTLAAAFSPSAVSGVAIGGGDTTANKRAVIGVAGSGQLGIHWGTGVNETAIVDRRNTDMIVVVSGDASGRDVWLWTATGGLVNITGLFAAAVGSPDGTGGEMALCGRRNASGGTPDLYLAGKFYAALARNKQSTEGEISNIIVPGFRSAIQ